MIQANTIEWVIAINIEQPTTAQGALDEIQTRQNKCGK